MLGRNVAVFLCAVSLISVVVVGAPSQAMTASDAGPQPQVGTETGPDGSGIMAGPPDPGQIIMSFRIHSDGSATASVSYWIRLDGKSNATAFENFRQSVRSNRSAYITRIERRMEATVSNAERTTGREMSVENISIRAYRGTQQYGVFEYTFNWQGFGATEGDRIVIGPGLSGLHLNSATKLFISWPENYQAQSIASTVSERRTQSAVWVGPMTFGRSGPRIVLQRAGPYAQMLGMLPGGGSGLMPIAGMAIFLIMSSVAVIGRFGTGVLGRLGDGAAVPDADDTDDGSADAESAPDSESADADEDPTGSVQDHPPELMSDPESLLWELEERGGRAKQKELVETLGWSDAKGSRVISDLREDDEVETFRLGNENVLTLPDEQGLMSESNTDRGDNNE